MLYDHWVSHRSSSWLHQLSLSLPINLRSPTSEDTPVRSVLSWIRCWRTLDGIKLSSKTSQPPCRRRLCLSQNALCCIRHQLATGPTPATYALPLSLCESTWAYTGLVDIRFGAQHSVVPMGSTACPVTDGLVTCDLSSSILRDMTRAFVGCLRFCPRCPPNRSSGLKLR